MHWEQCRAQHHRQHQQHRADLQRRRGAMLLQVSRQPGERAAAHAPPGQSGGRQQQHIGGAVGEAFLVGGQQRGNGRSG